MGGLTDDLRAKTWCHLALRLHHLGRDWEAHIAAVTALELDPTMAFAHTTLAMIWSRRGIDEEAVSHGRRAYDLDPTLPENELGLAFSLLFAGCWAEGLRHFEARFAYKLRQYADWPYPKWQCGPVGTLLVVSEQGLGDALSFARFVPLVVGCVVNVVFAVQPELVSLLSACLPDVTVVPFPKVFPAVHAWVSVVSLPVVLGLTDEHIAACPGLPVRGLYPRAGWQLPGRRFRIGICWAGSAANDIDKWRSMAGPEGFLRLLEVADVELYSFQIGARAAELHTCGAVALIRDLSPWLTDCSAAASILQEMDLVITVETFLGHLAGFLGKECWVLDSYRGGDYRIGRGGRPVLWYDKHRVFRQDVDAVWDPVWSRVVAALKEKVDGWRDKAVGRVGQPDRGAVSALHGTDGGDRGEAGDRAA